MMLKASNIYKTFKSGDKMLQILNGAEISVEKGEMVALMGVSGSGKSTLLHILGLINKPDRGELYLLNEKIDFGNKDDLAKKRNRNIGFVFQFYSLISELNVIENVMLPAMMQKSKVQKERGRKLLDIVGFDRDMDSKAVYRLSGGEMQRVALARALINDPDIVIADEPTANLDKTSSIDIVTAMKDINRSTKKTFIIATHSDEIANFCDRILLLNGGVVSEKNS